MTFLAVLKNYKLYNERVHDLWRRMIADPNISTFECQSSNDTIDFIDQNKDDPSKTLLIYHYQHTNLYILELLNHINTHPNIQMRIVFFTFDYWHRGDYPYTTIWAFMCRAKNHRVVTFAPDFTTFQQYHKIDLSYRDHIYHFNLWCCYDSSFLPFNDNPINAIAVSGAVSGAYPERLQMLKLEGVIRLAKNLNEVRTVTPAYNQRLRRYLCCFASSVHAQTARRRKINTHLILLKVFEILATGALLLCPRTEKEYLLSIGLIDGIHYLTVKDYKSVGDILDPVNRPMIDEIRRAGQEYARENLTSDKKYLQLKQLLRLA